MLSIWLYVEHLAVVRCVEHLVFRLGMADASQLRGTAITAGLWACLVTPRPPRDQIFNRADESQRRRFLLSGCKRRRITWPLSSSTSAAAGSTAVAATAALAGTECCSLVVGPAPSHSDKANETVMR